MENSDSGEYVYLFQGNLSDSISTLKKPSSSRLYELRVDLFRRFSFNKESKHEQKFNEFELRFNTLEQRLNEVLA
jgi:hypothetical protein